MFDCISEWCQQQCSHQPVNKQIVVWVNPVPGEGIGFFMVGKWKFGDYIHQIYVYSVITITGYTNMIYLKI
jgi:hypothetical protein